MPALAVALAVMAVVVAGAAAGVAVPAAPARGVQGTGSEPGMVPGEG